jgi:hypothetical protein
MDRHAEAVNVYWILKHQFFVSKVLGLSAYSAVGDIGNRHIIVTMSIIICSLGIIIQNFGVLAYGVLKVYISVSGSAAQRGLWLPRSRGSLITHNDAPQSVGLLWTSGQFVAETST